MAPISNHRFGWALPGVILNFATTYLRMIPQIPVAAKEGGMKQFGDIIHIFLAPSFFSAPSQFVPGRQESKAGKWFI